MDLSKLEKIKFLGNGFHGYVYLVKYRKKEYALKVSYINPEDLNNYNVNLDNEQNLNKRIIKKYPNQFTKLIKYSILEDCNEKSGDTNMRIFSIYKKCLFRLYSIVNDTWQNIEPLINKYNLNRKYSMFLQLFNIYSILEKNNYVHGDLLDKNIGIKYTTDEYIKIHNNEIPTYGIYIQLIDYDMLLSKEKTKYIKYNTKRIRDKNNIIFLMIENNNYINNYIYDSLNNIEKKEFYSKLREEKQYINLKTLTKNNIELNEWLVYLLYPNIYRKLLNDDKLENAKYLLPIKDILNIVKKFNDTEKIIEYLINKLK